MTRVKALLRLASILTCFLLIATATAAAEDICIANNPQTIQPAQIEQPTVETSVKGHTPYQGILKIYVVEPESRWRLYGSGGAGTGDPYHFGFLGFAANQAITINVGDTLSNTVTFTYAGGGLSSHNLMAIAVVFNQEGHAAQSRPGYTTNPYTAHWVDAAIGVVDGEVASDTAHGAYTHNVFVEECTGSWCSACPPAAAALYSVYASGSYPFYFVALVEDKNAQANARCVVDYNIYGFPSTFYDGGYSMTYGGVSNPVEYQNKIAGAGARASRDLFLQAGLTVISETQVQVTYKIAARDLNTLPAAAQPTNNCPMIRVNEATQFLCNLTDADADSMWVRWTFGTGDTTAWIGPYANGENCGFPYEWTTAGTYDVKVLVKDRYDISTTWSTARTVNVVDCSCGDANGDHAVDISDAVFLISHIFTGGAAPGPCDCSGTGKGLGDANGDSTVDISDAVYLISHIFTGGPAPHCP